MESKWKKKRKEKKRRKKKKKRKRKEKEFERRVRVDKNFERRNIENVTKREILENTRWNIVKIIAVPALTKRVLTARRRWFRDTHAV